MLKTKKRQEGIAPWWWPFGASQRVLLCDESLREHECDEDLMHGYRHRCHCGIRWAKATQLAEVDLDAIAEALRAQREARESFPLGILRRKPIATP